MRRTIEIHGWADVGSVNIYADKLLETWGGYGVAYHVEEDPGRYCHACAMNHKTVSYGNVIHASNYARTCARCGANLKAKATR